MYCVKFATLCCPVGVLLHHLETHIGIVVLITNKPEAIDTAFQRRIRFSMTFPMPDASLRYTVCPQNAQPSSQPHVEMPILSTGTKSSQRFVGSNMQLCLHTLVCLSINQSINQTIH